jgi:hypothetical protein
MGSGDNCNWCGCDDDVAFLHSVVADVTAMACVDMDRIYLTGNSQGGMMTSWMYARAHDLFAAYAPQSGTNPRDFWNNPDDPNAEASVLFVHGTRDNTVPHDGDPASDGYNYTAVWDEVQRMSEYAFISCNGWESRPIPSVVSAPKRTKLKCEQMSCNKENGDEREFEYCTFAGGHVWPKNGNGEGGQWGNRLIWDFFVQHCNEPGNGCSQAYIPPSEAGGSCEITENPEVSCDDGQDNDCDTFIDAADSDCDTGGGLPAGASCTSNSECASNRCKGRRNAKICK